MKLAIDPGHGMSNRKAGVYDPGAISGDAHEATIVLDWGLTIKHIFTEAGRGVYLTRFSAENPARLGRRVPEAVAAGCTHFLSLHCNSNAGAPGTGTETLTPLGRCRPFASYIQRSALQVLGLKDRGIKERGNLSVLRFPGSVCLLELGFINNPTDRVALLSRDNRIAFAEKLLAWFEPPEEGTP